VHCNCSAMHCGGQLAAGSARDSGP
jgi:hypothetical protein